MPNERTYLTPEEEARFQQWARANKIADVDAPESHYDYRGYWKEYGDKPMQFGVDHFTDTYKQHGHDLFSIESQYSQGPWDGGRWQPGYLTRDRGMPVLADENYAPTGADLMMNSRGQSRLPSDMLRQALLFMMTQGKR